MMEWSQEFFGDIGVRGVGVHLFFIECDTFVWFAVTSLESYTIISRPRVGVASKRL